MPMAATRQDNADALAIARVGKFLLKKLPRHLVPASAKEYDADATGTDGVLGAVAIVVMLWAPKGLWGLIAERFNWQALPLQRHLVLEKETGGKP
jgi:hypothetical protein